MFAQEWIEWNCQKHLASYSPSCSKSKIILFHGTQNYILNTAGLLVMFFLCFFLHAIKINGELLSCKKRHKSTIKSQCIPKIKQKKWKRYSKIIIYFLKIEQMGPMLYLFYGESNKPLVTIPLLYPFFSMQKYAISCQCAGHLILCPL